MISIVEAANPVSVIAGAGAADAALASFKLGDAPLVLRDPCVELSAPARSAGAIEIAIEASSAGDDLLLDVLRRGRRATSVIALGGGSTLDLAKIARLLLVAPRLAEPLRALVARSGFVRIPDLIVERGPEIPLLAIPTTFGTASEVSPVACVTTPHGRRLLSGPGLRPDLAALDPHRTKTLPRLLQAEGLFEVILRVSGPAIGSVPSLAADGDAQAIVAGAAGLAERLRSGDLDPDERLYAAQLSAASHRGWALVGRASYAAKHWYLANELATVTGSRKIPATTAVLPAIWGRVADGDQRWGSRGRLAQVWSWLTASVPGLPDDVRTGLPALFHRWGLRPIAAPSESALRDAATRTVASWGGVLPALNRIDRQSILQVFAESFPDAPAGMVSGN